MTDVLVSVSRVVARGDRWGLLHVAAEALACIATANGNGMPHVAPICWVYNGERDTIDIGGHDLGQTKRFRDVQRAGRAAPVIDDDVPPL